MTIVAVDGEIAAGILFCTLAAITSIEYQDCNIAI